MPEDRDLEELKDSIRYFVQKHKIKYIRIEIFEEKLKELDAARPEEKTYKDVEITISY